MDQKLNGLDKLTDEGLEVLAASDSRDVIDAHTSFEQWVKNGVSWLKKAIPETGLAAEWVALPFSSLVQGGHYDTSAMVIHQFKVAVRTRLSWLANLPKRTELSTPDRIQNEAKAGGRREIKLNTISRAYVDPDRIGELQKIQHPDFDLRRLVRLCEEVNLAFAAECYFSLIMLTRAIIDHVPPIFNATTFSQVAAQARRSVKSQFESLDTSMRKIADMHLHSHVRKVETLPNVTQINYSNALDVLLAEIISSLTTRP